MGLEGKNHPLILVGHPCPSTKAGGGVQKQHRQLISPETPPVLHVVCTAGRCSGAGAGSKNWPRSSADFALSSDL